MFVHMEWGAQALREEADIFVLVDVLSFSTCVTVALEQGAEILPYYYKDQRAQQYAIEHQAKLVGPRSHTQPSLSPASLRRVSPGERWVLPSPNGATLSFDAQRQYPRAQVWAASFRNAHAIAQALLQSQATRVQLIAFGERWPDGSLRPAIEDVLGVGAVLTALFELDQTASRFSAEAKCSQLSYQAVETQLSALLKASLSGQELIERGFPEDLELAFEQNVCQRVAVLDQGVYRGRALSELPQ